MQEFKDMLDECGFQDLGFEGGKFTWCKAIERDTRFGKGWIK